VELQAQTATSFDDRNDGGNSWSGLFASNVYPIASAKSYRAHRVLGQVVAQFQLRIVQEAAEPAPKRQCVIAGLGREKSGNVHRIAGLLVKCNSFAESPNFSATNRSLFCKSPNFVQRDIRRAERLVFQLQSQQTSLFCPLNQSRGIVQSVQWKKLRQKHLFDIGSIGSCSKPLRCFSP
jgi:hypothetical protein